MKKLTVAGMYLWNVQIEWNGYLNRKERQTLIVATRRNVMAEAQKKATTFLKTNRDIYPKARIAAIQDAGTVDA